MDENNQLNKKYQKIDEAEFTPNVSEKPPKKKKKATEPKPPKEKKVKEPKSPKEKKVKEPKSPKEKKVKEPKPPQEKKVKEPKPPKEKKVKEPKPPKEKKVKEPKPPKEKKPREPMQAKDWLTIAAALFAVICAAGFAYIKYVPQNEPTAAPPSTTAESDRLTDIQAVRQGMLVNLVQSDISDIFYGFTADYQIQYYQYRDNKMVPIQSSGKVSVSVDMGNEELPADIEYVSLGGQLFGIGIFRADKNTDVYFYDMVTFKIVNLPKEYSAPGKALLLASDGATALVNPSEPWEESFTLNLETGATSRFLSIINRSIDMTGAGRRDFCMLTQAGYESNSSAIPFLTSREYEAGSNKTDIFVKNGKRETLLVSDVFGKYLLTDGDSLIYLKKTSTGFDVVKKTGDKEEIVFNMYGSFSAEHLVYGDYLFSKTNGKLYNVKTGEVKTIVGYKMTPEMFAVSPDGKYLVMTGTVDNVLDYQIHIFDLQTGDYSKFTDKNYSSHFGLTFINDFTPIYVAIDPNQGFEYVALDLLKLKK